MAGVQARITLPADVRRDIDVLRTRWNPERAAGNPAHVTVVYHDEAPDPLLLADRLRAAAREIAPFRLTFGPVARFPEPVRGAYLPVVDPTGGVAAIREALLAPPFTRRGRFGLHVTLLHPDQGARLESAWAALSALPDPGAFEVTELQLVGPRHETLIAVRLSHARPPTIDPML
jgi:2'-5' RNA ligase